MEYDLAIGIVIGVLLTHVGNYFTLLKQFKRQDEQRIFEKTAANIDRTINLFGIIRKKEKSDHQKEKLFFLKMYHEESNKIFWSFGPQKLIQIWAKAWKDRSFLLTVKDMEN